MGYHGAFQSSDQIPQRLVTDGALNPYGLIDPFDGGTTYRYALSTPVAAPRRRGHHPNQRLRLRAIPQSLLELHLLPRRRHRLLQRHAQPDHVHDCLHDLRSRPAPSRFVRLVLPGKQRARRAARRHAIDRARCVHVSPAATSASKKISASSRASIFSERFNSSGSATTTAGIGVAKRQHLDRRALSHARRGPVSRRHAQSRARRRTRQLRVDADAAARRAQAAAHARAARRSLQLQRRRASRGQLRPRKLRHRQPEVHGRVRCSRRISSSTPIGEKASTATTRAASSIRSIRKRAPPTTRSAKPCCKTRRSRAPRGSSSATATRAAGSTARFRSGSFI